MSNFLIVLFDILGSVALTLAPFGSLSSSCAFCTLIELCSMLAFLWCTLDNSQQPNADTSTCVNIMQIICKFYANEMYDEPMTFSHMNIITARQILNFLTASLKSTLLWSFSPQLLYQLKEQSKTNSLILKSLPEVV